MAQQINLADPRFVPRALPWSARHALMAAVGVLALTGVAAQALSWSAARATADAQAVEEALGSLRRQLVRLAGQTPDPSQELLRLQATEASQRRIRNALAAGVAGNREGHAEYLLALARQAPGTVWITAFSVSEDGSAIDLEGRMSDTAVFAQYLRRLNAEPRFKGRPFAQLQLKALAEPGSHSGSMATEFVLRSSVPVGATGAVGTSSTGAAAGAAPGAAP